MQWECKCPVFGLWSLPRSPPRDSVWCVYSCVDRGPLWRAFIAQVGRSRLYHRMSELTNIYGHANSEPKNKLHLAIECRPCGLVSGEHSVAFTACFPIPFPPAFIVLVIFLAGRYTHARQETQNAVSPRLSYKLMTTYGTSFRSGACRCCRCLHH